MPIRAFVVRTVSELTLLERLASEIRWTQQSCLLEKALQHPLVSQALFAARHFLSFCQFLLEPLAGGMM